MAAFGGYRTMWLVVMFDLPTKTSEDRGEYQHFHDFLLDDGFIRMQFSVYARHCSSEENCKTHMERVHAALPPHGEIRLMTFTDKQFSRTIVFQGHLRKLVEIPPEQVLLL
jgi:CRISPR-associated protein Cas2